MHDSGKIISGIIIFLVIVTGPVWYDLSLGNPDYVPNPKIIGDAKECVMPTDYMRTSHMDLLNVWRDKVVREGDRTHASPNGQEYEMSLTKTCLGCHSNKAQFCDECHNYTAVDELYCWDCHSVPEEVK